MKKLSDYQGEQAIELWADLLVPLTNIFGDPKMQNVFTGKMPRIKKAQKILTAHKEDTEAILLKIDPTPLNGLNIVVRLVNLILEIENSEEIKGFFASARQASAATTSSGDVTETTTENEK